MKRPLAMRLSPNSLKEKLFFRFYRNRQSSFPSLFEEASLRFAPRAKMFDLLPGDAISGMIAFTGYYELSLSKQIVQLAKGGGLLVDVGANLGYFSILWASCQPNCRAICYEASPRNIKSLTNNISRNALCDRIQIVPKAVGKDVGTINFDVGPPDQTGWGGITDDSTARSSVVTTQLTRLDNELSDEHIEVLKIDVEGADTWVLMGCESLLRKKSIGRIFYEQNKSRMEILGIVPGAAQSFLRDVGYTPLPLNRSETEWTAKPSGRF